MVIPTGNPYMRDAAPVASADHRLEMCSLALDDLPDALQEKTMVLDIETRRKGTTYSIETLHQLRAFFPKDNFTLILGSDSAATFPKWQRADDIKKQAKILVIKRPGAPTSEFEEVNVKALDISATAVRAALSSGKGASQYLSPSVAKYIKERGLYVSK
jgi:nicotinate-nucleotide adenylyltransferase